MAGEEFDSEKCEGCVKEPLVIRRLLGELAGVVGRFRGSFMRCLSWMAQGRHQRLRGSVALPKSKGNSGSALKLVDLLEVRLKRLIQVLENRERFVILLACFGSR